MMRARGNGFGAYKNTHIEWSGFAGPSDDFTYTFSGQLKADSE